jgi:hypothetical protein
MVELSLKVVKAVNMFPKGGNDFGTRDVGENIFP